MTGLPPPTLRERAVATALLAATLLTTTWAGMLQALPEAAALDFLEGRQGAIELFAAHWPAGLPFSLTLLAILGVHEAGHYVFARRHRMATSLPWFLPAPTLIGTFGALIRMRGPLWSRRAIVDVGAAGPLAGFAVAVPVYVAGLLLSDVRPIAGIPEGSLMLGESLLTRGLAWLVFGALPEGHEVFLHPVAFAGWIGFFVTTLNMLPLGQLDGGHIVYGLFPRRHRPIARLTLAGLLLAGWYGWQGWFFWAAMGVLVGAGRHPAPVWMEEELDRRSALAGWAALAVFVLTFIPAPFAPFSPGP